jgi:hypothetical protein
VGVAAAGRCFSTVDLAAAYSCGQAFPVANVGVDSTGTVISAVLECASTTGAVMNLSRYKNGGSPQALQVTYAGPPCDELEWMAYNPVGLSAADGSLIAAAVAGVWCAAWAWKYIYRTVWGGGGGPGEE